MVDLVHQDLSLADHFSKLKVNDFHSLAMFSWNSIDGGLLCGQVMTFPCSFPATEMLS